MTRPPISLDLIQVASPCHASWDQMQGDDRRRLCRHCNQHVYNLSGLPRAEADALVNQAEGRICVRFFRRADGTVLTRDCPVGLRAVRNRFLRAAAALGGLLLTLMSGTLFAGRLKSLPLPVSDRPSDAYSEWIEPGSTRTYFILGSVAWPPSATPLVTPPATGTFESQESPLPEPTPQQLEEIAERLTK